MLARFSYRLQFSLLIIGFILALSISSLMYLKHVQDGFIASNLETQGIVISDLIAEDLAKLIFLDDPDVAATVTLKLRSINEIQSAIFYDTDTKSVLNISSKSTSSSDLSVSTINTKVMFDGTHVGYAAINLYNEELIQLKSQAESFYVIFLVALIAVGIFIVILFDRRFILRLSQLSSALEFAAKDKDFSKRLEIDRNDDIGLAKKNFNQLVELVEEQTIDLIYRANHDGLTGLYNRNRLMERIDSLLLKRPESDFHAVCYMDLDQFKVVNDTCGHAVGDALLLQLSERFLTQMSNFPEVTIGRIGGDEFVVLIKDRPKSKIQQIIKSLQNVAQDFKFKFLEREFQVGVSIGCIIFSNEEVTADKVLSAADALCYQVKKMNRGDVLLQYLNDEKLLDYQSEMDWVAKIYDAFKQDKFRIYLQPIVALENAQEQWDHFEVLIRLYEKNEIISPFHFIPVAERYGLTKKLDAWVVEAVFSELKNNPGFLQTVQLVSINLSVLSIVDDNFKNKIEALFKQYEIPYSKICFEITETGVISELNNAQIFLRYFRQLGVFFSLDDFGSGMASFGYLTDLEVDILKIDGQFVKNMCLDPVMKEMVDAMIKIGHVCGKQVVAEHVEDKQTMQYLTKMNVDFIQGYFYSKPQPIKNFIQAAILS